MLVAFVIIFGIAWFVDYASDSIKQETNYRERNISFEYKELPKHKEVNPYLETVQNRWSKYYDEDKFS